MEFLHTDPNSGLSYYSEEAIDGKEMTIRSQQDVEPVLNEAARRRNSGAGDKPIAEHIRHYCYLPNSVALQMRQKGINMFNPKDDDWKRFFIEIETNYPMLKVTDKRGWRPS